MSPQLGEITLKNHQHEEKPEYTLAFLKKMFGLTRLPKNGLKVIGNQRTFNEAAPEFVDGQSISGVQKKLFMDLQNDRLVPVKGHGQYIVKPAPENFASLPENEHAMMQLARFCKFEVADNALVPFEDGELCYVTRRFDLLADGRRLFVEDAASLCNIHSSNKGSDNLAYENIIRSLYLASGKNKAVIYHGIRQVLFAYLIGNNDLHCKNFSLYRYPDDATTRMRGFTPIYDVLSVAPYKEYFKEDLTLCVLASELDAKFSPEFEQNGYYSFQCFHMLGTQLGLPEAAATKLITSLCNDVAKFYLDVLENSAAEGLAEHISTKLKRLRPK
jgi:serine/threonine-protein kinase HipA